MYSVFSAQFTLIEFCYNIGTARAVQVRYPGSYIRDEITGLRLND